MDTEQALEELGEVIATTEDTDIVRDEITVRINGDEYMLHFGVEDLRVETEWVEENGERERETLIDIVPDGTVLDSANL